MLTPTVKCFYARRVLACVSLAVFLPASDVVANGSDQPKHRDGVNADKEQVEGDGIH